MANDNKIFVYGLIFGAVLLFCLSLTSAFEFDNYYRYNETTKTATIKNGLTLGSEIASIRLVTPQEFRVPENSYTYIMEIEISGAVDYDDSISDISLHDKKQNMKKWSKEYDLKYYDEKKDEWKKFTDGKANIKKNEKLRIRIYTNVGKDEAGEWYANFMGAGVDTGFGTKGIKEWATWTSYSSIIAGLTGDFGTNSRIDIFNVSNNMYGIITSQNNAEVRGYEWDGDSWEKSYTANSSFLQAVGTPRQYEPYFESFYYEGELYGLLTIQNGDVEGYKWSGGSWVNDYDINESLASAKTNFKIDVFEWSDGELYGISGENNGGKGVFTGYKFLGIGSGWTTDVGIRLGLNTYASPNNIPVVFNTSDGSYHMVSGLADGNIYGFSWNETNSSWSPNSSLVSGLIDVGGDSCPEVIIYSGNITLITGAGDGYFDGYMGWPWGSDIIDNPPTTELGTPTNETEYNSNSILLDFTCKGIDDINLDNLTFIIYNRSNNARLYTEVNTDGQNDTLETFSYTVTGGTNYSWNCLATDNSSNSDYATNNNTIFVYSIPDNAPNIEIASGSPADNSKYFVSPMLVTFNASNVYDDNKLDNVSLYINKNGAGYVLNQTNTSGLNNTNYVFSLIPFTEGVYYWYLSATDNASQTSTTTPRNFSIDSTTPTLKLNAPVVNTSTKTLPLNIELNFTASDTNLNTSSCYYNITTPVYFSCNTLVNMTFTTGGLYNISYGASDTYTNTNSGSFNYYVLYYNETVDYTATVLEGETNTITLYINATEINTVSANITYAGVEYPATLINNTGTLAELQSVFNVPTGQNTTESKSFNFTFLIDDLSDTTSTYTQTVTFLTPLNVTSASCSDKALKFTMIDEVNLSNVTGDLYYNIYYGTQNNSLKSAYGFINDTNSFYLCINGSLNRNYIIGYGEFQYETDDHEPRRYYLFYNSTLNNDTYEERFLRNILTSQSVTFKNTFEDRDLSVYSGDYVALWRWYPGEDSYLLVEMAKTDEDGEAISHVITEDVDYRTALYFPNGSLIKYGEPKRFICASSPCTFTFRVDADESNYNNILDVENSLEYNYTTQVFTLFYNDPTQATSSVRLVVTRETGTDTLTICDESSVSFTGVLTCNTSLYTGTKKATVYRSASPPIVLNQKIVGDAPSGLNNTLGLFISVLLFLAIVFTGIVSPVWSIVLAVIGLIPAFMFGSINIAIFTGVAVLGVIVIHFIKRSLAR